MLWYSSATLLLLLNAAFGLPRGKATEKPEIPPIANPVVPKNRKPPTHISEFTDPDTGLNPFLDLEEGQTSINRNVMEDEIRDDTPYFDIDLVEGDAPNRRWGFQEPKETLDKAPVVGRWPAGDYKDDNYDFPVVTTPLFLPNPPTTVETVAAKSTETFKPEADESDKELQHQVIQDEKESFVVSHRTVIYASATIAAVATIVLLVGGCWWRRKIKTPQSRVENGDVKC